MAFESYISELGMHTDLHFSNKKILSRLATGFSMVKQFKTLQDICLVTLTKIYKVFQNNNKIL